MLIGVVLGTSTVGGDHINQVPCWHIRCTWTLSSCSICDTNVCTSAPRLLIESVRQRNVE